MNTNSSSDDICGSGDSCPDTMENGSISRLKRRKKTPTKEPTSSENRRLAQASRTLKACELCRKQKVRCFRTPDNPNSCLRCAILNRVCSFESNGDHEIDTTTKNHPEGRKIDMIYDGISEILTILRSGNPLPAAYQVPKPDQDRYQDDKHDVHMAPSESLIISPFAIIHKENDQVIPNVIPNLVPASQNTNRVQYDDVISNGILTLSQVTDLMMVFRQNYGRWVLFPSSLSTETLIERIRLNSSFLLTTCCCLSLRYSINGSFDNLDTLIRARNTMKLLKQKLLRDLEKSVTKVTSTFSGQVEFLQALVILSIYSYSLTSIFSGINDDDIIVPDIDPTNKFSLDPWLLSSIGLTAFQSKSVFGNLFKNPTQELSVPSPLSILYNELDTKEYQTLTFLRLYNHLCLVHLINCVFTGRMCVLDEIRLNYCTAALSLPSATNFDGRMVSEIEILLITYNYIQVNLNVFNNNTPEESFRSVLEEISYWHDQWEYIFHQPTLEFVELCYNFCSLLVYFTFNYHKIKQNSGKKRSPIYDETSIQFVIELSDSESIKKMIHFSYLVVRKVHNIENDSYFAYLSDQIHISFYFSGLLFIKLLFHLVSQNTLLVLNSTIGPDLDPLDLKTMIHDLHELINIFIRIGQGNPDDILTKYGSGLRKALDESGL